MSTATFTIAEVKAAKAIASADVKVHHAASVVGVALARIQADDQSALTAFWKALGAEMKYGPHAEYWATHNTGGRKAVSTWAAFYRAAAVKFNHALAFANGIPTVAAVRAFTTGAESLNVEALTEALSGDDAEPFTVKAVKDALGVIKRGPKAAKVTKADKAVAEAVKAAKAEAKAEAKAIVAKAKDDAKAVTLGKMVSFIAEQADEAMLSAIEKAVTQARARMAAAEAI